MKYGKKLLVSVVCFFFLGTLHLEIRAQTIYKCGQTYTDKPCSGGQVVEQIPPEFVKQAKDQDEINEMYNAMRMGRIDTIRAYAQKKGEMAQFNIALEKYRIDLETQQANAYAASALRQSEQQNQLNREIARRENECNSRFDEREAKIRKIFTGVAQGNGAALLVQLENARNNCLYGTSSSLTSTPEARPQQIFPHQNNWAARIGQCQGQCAAEQGICVSQCQGNGQCVANCASSQGRCTASCSAAFPAGS